MAYNSKRHGRHSQYWHWIRGKDTPYRYARRIVNSVRSMRPYAKKYGWRYYIDWEMRQRLRRQRENARQTLLYGSYYLHHKKEIRARLAKRDGHKCMSCFQKKTLAQLSIDHVMPVSKGGRSQMANMQLLCIPCHAIKSVMDNPNDGKTMLVRYRERFGEAKSRL